VAEQVNLEKGWSPVINVSKTIQKPLNTEPFAYHFLNKGIISRSGTAFAATTGAARSSNNMRSPDCYLFLKRPMVGLPQ
jgi:hypothetical protein